MIEKKSEKNLALVFVKVMGNNQVLGPPVRTGPPQWKRKSSGQLAQMHVEGRAAR